MALINLREGYGSYRSQRRLGLLSISEKVTALMILEKVMALIDFREGYGSY